MGNNITDKELRELKEQYKRAKGITKVDCTKEELVDAVNLLMCHMGAVDNLTDTVVGMKMFLERMGLENECFIAIYSGDFRPRLRMWDDGQLAEVE